MRYAIGAILITAGGIALAWWHEDPFVRRDATLQRLLSNPRSLGARWGSVAMPRD